MIVRNKSHGEIKKVCMRIFKTDVRNIKYDHILNKNILPYFHNVSLVI